MQSMMGRSMAVRALLLPSIQATLMAVSLLWGATAVAQTTPDPSKFDWRPGPASFDVPGQVATMKVRAEDAFLTGRDVPKLIELAHGRPMGDADVAVGRPDSVIYVRHGQDGHIKTDDWRSAIDTSLLLKHLDPNRVFVAGVAAKQWIEPPTLDGNVIYYALGEKPADGVARVALARAIVLSRYGYSEITWVGEPTAYGSFKETFGPILADFSIPEAASHAKFDPTTDKVAPYGAGALVVKSLTGLDALPKALLSLPSLGSGGNVAAAKPGSEKAGGSFPIYWLILAVVMLVVGWVLLRRSSPPVTEVGVSTPQGTKAETIQPKRKPAHAQKTAKPAGKPH